MRQLAVKNITLAYDGTPVVENLSFEVNKGDYLCIVGENGSGKSTLMKSLSGLVAPIEGNIQYFLGADGKSVGYLPQLTQVQRDFPASVKEVVMSGFAGKKRGFLFYGKEMKTIAFQNMKMLGVEQLADRCYRELSGGQQQRVLLARALCAADSMLLLDEPVTGLDPNAAADMYSVIKELNLQGLTIIMISHDIKSAVADADKILHLSNDEVFFGLTADYLKSEIGSNYIKGE